MSSRQRPEHRREGETGPVPELHEAYRLGVELLMAARQFQEMLDRSRPPGQRGAWSPRDSAHEVASRLVVAAIGNHRLDDPWPWRFPRRSMLERLFDLQRHVYVERLDGHLEGNEQVDAAALWFVDLALALVGEAEWLMEVYESTSVDAEACHVDICRFGNLRRAQDMAATAGTTYSHRTVEAARMLVDGNSDPCPQTWLALLDRLGAIERAAGEPTDAAQARATGGAPAPIASEPGTPVEAGTGHARKRRAA